MDVSRGHRAPGGRLPVIVFNRGRWTWESFHPQLLVMAHRLAEAGDVVVAPMYRGSGGAPGQDEMGGAELDDLLMRRRGWRWRGTLNRSSTPPTRASGDPGRKVQ